MDVSSTLERLYISLVSDCLLFLPQEICLGDQATTVCQITGSGRFRFGRNRQPRRKKRRGLGEISKGVNQIYIEQDETFRSTNDLYYFRPEIGLEVNVK